MNSARLSTIGGLFDTAFEEQSSSGKRDSALKTAWYLALSILAVGLLSRLSPLFDVQGRIFWQFMTEDGYLMQTVSRNMALGLGMSTAEGTIPTNGVQPLATYIFAALHWLAGGDRQTAIALVTAVSAAIAAGGAFLLYRVSLLLLAPLRYAQILAVIVTAAWFASAATVNHSMNGLETGLYVLVLLAATHYFLTVMQEQAESPRWKAASGLGVLLGFAFLARNDAVFFIAAVLGAHLLVGSLQRRDVAVRLQECIVAGIISIAVGLPWMINNYYLFGTIVPISGISQSNAAAFGGNLGYIPANLLENMLPTIGVPRSLEKSPAVILLALAAVASLLALFWVGFGKRNILTRRFSFIMLVFAASLSLYYGLFFGAPHFIPRYMSSASPMLWLAAATALFALGMGVLGDTPLFRRLMAGAVGVLLVVAAISGWHKFRADPHAQMHKQVVDWAAANVEPQRWVGAVQTGTLGFFHDRTLNLDGKVNPAALRALLANGNVFDYVIASPIDYIIDWAGVGGWIDLPYAGRLREAFALEVRDESQNLSVMKRKQLHPLQ